MTDVLPWTKPANGGEFPGRQRCYQKKPRGFYIAREAAKVGEKPENVEAEGKMIFFGSLSLPFFEIIFTRVRYIQWTAGWLWIRCPFTDIHASLVCWDRHTPKVNLLYCNFFHAHWIGYFLYFLCICICILNIHFVHKSTVFSSSFWMEVWRYLAETLNLYSQFTRTFSRFKVTNDKKNLFGLCSTRSCGVGLSNLGLGSDGRKNPSRIEPFAMYIHIYIYHR